MDTKIYIGESSDFIEGKGKEITVENKKMAVYRYKGTLGCIGNSCLHAGGPLCDGTIQEGRVYCPWHQWDWDFQTGKGFGEEGVGGYKIWEQDGKVYIDLKNPLAEKVVAPVHQEIKIGDLEKKDLTTVSDKKLNRKIRILGISTTSMNHKFARPSTSEHVLLEALKKYNDPDKYETRIIKLRDLHFAECEGYYSMDKSACTWPCTITQADKKDEMIEVYRGLTEWCDIVVVATPIRWGCASSLYYKMQERLNCLQNQITLYNNVLIQNKAACFIITGGQDNVQSVAGQMLTFFSEIGFIFPQFPFIGWTRGWSNEDMKTNFSDVQKSDLVDQAADMISRAEMIVKKLLG